MVISVPGGAGLATSSTQRRRWRRGGEVLHHVFDPSTGRPAPPVWRSVCLPDEQDLTDGRADDRVGGGGQGVPPGRRRTLAGT
jgi:hypothetical protein